MPRQHLTEIKTHYGFGERNSHSLLQRIKAAKWLLRRHHFQDINVLKEELNDYDYECVSQLETQLKFFHQNGVMQFINSPLNMLTKASDFYTEAMMLGFST